MAPAPPDPAVRWQAWRHLPWIVPLGFALKLYGGPGAWWINDYAAAVAYELFWILACFGLLRSRRAVVGVPVGVFAVTAALELLQLSRAAAWRPIRASFLGQALFGTTFDPWDFPVYLGSCVLGWLYLRRLAGSEVVTFSASEAKSQRQAREAPRASRRHGRHGNP